MRKRTLLTLVAASLLAVGSVAYAADDMVGHQIMMAGGPDHGMPAGFAGGDGLIYTGAPDLDAAVSLVTAGGQTPGNFSIVTALTALAGPKVTNAEAAKLIKQYGQPAWASYVSVQNYAVNDAVAKAIKAGVKFPTPTLTGAALAVRITKLGLYKGTYYEGYMLDHIVTHGIHEAVMADIDKTYSKDADANYHRLADQAHYDLAQALGAKTVKLAVYH
jgi:hypothetical protein